jgi:hypothetical protein
MSFSYFLCTMLAHTVTTSLLFLDVYLNATALCVTTLLYLPWPDTVLLISAVLNNKLCCEAAKQDS